MAYLEQLCREFATKKNIILTENYGNDEQFQIAYSCSICEGTETETLTITEKEVSECKRDVSECKILVKRQYKALSISISPAKLADALSRLESEESDLGNKVKKSFHGRQQEALEEEKYYSETVTDFNLPDLRSLLFCFYR